MQSSADLNIIRATEALDRGYPIAAMNRALRACTYAGGVFAPEYVALYGDAENIAAEIEVSS
jgi:hypothetical protein